MIKRIIGLLNIRSIANEKDLTACLNLGLKTLFLVKVVPRILFNAYNECGCLLLS